MTARLLADLRCDALDILRAGLARAHAGHLVARAVAELNASLASTGPLSVVAVGKAAAPMASAFADAFYARIRGGIVIGPGTRSGAPPGFELWSARHPVPDERSEAAAQRALRLARSVEGDDGRLVVLLSGGASALMALPAAGISLVDKAEATSLLLAAGVPIQGLNCVRKHLSGIKGGRLAAAARASLTLAISDVVGPPPDDPSAIGSGPTVADPTTFADALALVNETGLRARFPRAALERLERGARGQEEETVKPGDPRLARSVYRLIGNRLDALAGAREAAETRGYRTVVISTPMVGEAREAGVRLMDLGAQSRAAAGRPLCLLAAGETTVHVRGTGKGGRNQELALAAAARGLRDAVFVLASVGTDGIDGPTDAAGAIVDSTTLARAAAAGVREPQGFLDENDSYRFFEPLGDLIKTGPTDTNVGDVQVLLVSGGVAPG